MNPNHTIGLVLSKRKKPGSGAGSATEEARKKTRSSRRKTKMRRSSGN
jgi:hypothetical protein